jgi:polysaccharide biosynthesis protein PslJ
LSSSNRAKPIDRGEFLPVWPTARAVPAPAWVVVAVFALFGLVGSVALAWIAVEWGFIVGAGVLIAAVATIAMLSDVRAGLWVTLGVVTLLPFAVVPVRVGVTLTALEVASLLVLGVWLGATLLYRDQLLPASVPAALIALFLVVTLFAFLLGIGRGYTAQTFHDYAKFIFASLLVFVVWTSARPLDDQRRLLNVLLLGGSLAAVIGLVFQALGPGFAERMLARLIPLGYPDTRIVRFIEDDPERSMRLVSTSVDPNSVGGMLAIVFVIGAVQLISRNRLLPVWLCVAAVPLSGLALLFTYSRGAWLGAAAGLGIAAVLRYRWMIPVGLAALAGLIALGVGAAFFERLWLGFTLQDPATRLRISEYQNAIAVIREYPVFGVGFGDAPIVELQTGVSSIYLAIGQQTGLLGLTLYLVAITAIAGAGFIWWRVRWRSRHGDLMLTLLAAFGTALVIGVFDHYFFNIQFPHMAALFWMLGGAILALSRPIKRERYSDDTQRHD